VLKWIVSGVKKFIKDYGKKEGYSYIYGTGDAATVLYAETSMILQRGCKSIER
jgi:hypothetical protein